MVAVRVQHVVSVALGLSAGIVAAGPLAFAQSSVKAIFEKHNLLGTFAFDCSKPASKANLYFVNRLLDADHVQRDVMEGRTNRQHLTIIDKASESRPNEIAVSGLRDGKPSTAVWRLEQNRMVVWEASESGKRTIAEGRVVANGTEWPWVNRCEASR